ncbi:MAG: glycoside hydrolase domain-containing protein [Phycisphaerae bacterium]
MARRALATVTLLLIVGRGVLLAGERTFSATVSFQDGVNNYEGGWDDSLRPGKLKLVGDVKKELDWWHKAQIEKGKLNRQTVLEGLSNYRHVIRWGRLDRWIKGGNVRVKSATVHLFYCDEFWSYYRYTVALHRALDGTKDRIDTAPAGVANIHGDRCAKDVKTPINSWIELDLPPEVVQGWIDDPNSNHGLVLLQQSKTETQPPKKSTGSGLYFRANSYGIAHLRPKLTITYTFTGNVPPFAPKLAGGFDGAIVGDVLPIRWSEVTPKRDLNGDPVSYEIRAGREVGGAVQWKTIARDIAAPAAQYLWDTSAAAKGKGYKVAVRARDSRGAVSEWSGSRHPFEIVAGRVSFNVGVATPVERIRRDEPPALRPAGSAAVSLAKGETEGLQLVLMNVMRPCEEVRVSVGPLKGPDGRALPAGSVTCSPVGYVKTTEPKYSVPRTGWWADPLLAPGPVRLDVGKVQPMWLSVRCPRDAVAGTYRGAVEIRTSEGETQAVKLCVTVWDFALPASGTLRTMIVDSARKAPAFYGLEAGTAEARKLIEAIYTKLCDSRIGPGMAMCGFDWDRPSYPVVYADGKYDFSEVDRLAGLLLPRGMNSFVIAKFPKPGKWGFPEQYSQEWKGKWSALVREYAAHLRRKGWVDKAYTYNIDEAPPSMWKACEQNYALSKAAAADVRVMQCLNNAKGVEALAGFADTWDVSLQLYGKSQAAERQAKGDEVWWNICCYPSSHPNLFLDYPAIDARIVGWLSWKLGVGGFEYWSATSWGKNTEPVTKVESDWLAKAFGQYNGDGYLLYPGPDGAVLSSIRMEALRDGFEDHEYLAILQRLVKAAGGAETETLAEARNLLAVPDSLCRRDLSYTSDPAVLLAYRARVARAIVALRAAGP